MHLSQIEYSPTPRPPPGRGTAAGRAVRVFMLIDEQPIYRRGLLSIVAEQAAFVCLGEATSCAQALHIAPTLAPDVVLVDAALPGVGDGSALTSLQRALPQARFVVLSSNPSAVDVCRAVNAGAASVLPKGVAAEQLVQAIRSAHGGPAPGVVEAGDAARRYTLGGDLTRRERDLLRLMAKGLSNQEIAATLGIALPTVKYHVTNILSKLNADNRTSAVLEALRHRIVDLG